MACTTLVAPAELNDRLAHPDWVVLDCRFDLLKPEAGRAAYAEGHLPGARYAHLNDDLAGPVTESSGRHPLPDPLDFARRLSAWGVGSGSQVVVYDDCGGAYAARAWWLLRWLGHGAVAVLNGGLPAWVRAGYALDRSLPDITPREFRPRVCDGAWVGSDRILAAVSAREFQLVDARTPERFAGKREPIDPVAGHIPGALNYPFEGNLAADGTFLSAEILRVRLASLLGDTAATAVVHYCGSGVTACHNLLAMEVAGLAGSRLYPGSWSEWIRDPARPVGTNP